MGSYFKVGGQLMMSIGKDGTNDPSYVALGKGALVRLGSLYNNASDWIGPTNGTAVLEIGQVNYLNWDFQNTPKHGYFINNIAITLSNKQNVCDRNDVWIAEYGENMTAYQKMNVLLINGTGGDKNYMGNGGTVLVSSRFIFAALVHLSTSIYILVKQHCSTVKRFMMLSDRLGVC